ncbi:hypothetical protein [Accumulibacter sp.]|uniref:hypothetical protein n=1 Tax=Accumulibacter sp. TaxID=2053492 RepID=UPI001AC6782D|nr:hypothetical protein [Accumulibacter sp.]MBN8453170.1 hypothetical protein [Accumulibacter sp.]
MKKPVQKASAPEVTADVGTPEEAAATEEAITAATPEEAIAKAVTAKAVSPKPASTKAATTKAATTKAASTKAATPKAVATKPAAAKAATTKAVNPAVQSLRILKVGRCPTVSGKSTLTYHVGCTAESAIQIRLYANSGNGFLNQDWIPWTAIQERLKPQSGESTFTSQVLHALFRGKSLNSPGFLMAVLKAEGVVKPSTVKGRCYEATKDARFLAEIERLMASAVDLAVDAAGKPAATSRPKKQAADTATEVATEAVTAATDVATEGSEDTAA